MERSWPVGPLIHVFTCSKLDAVLLVAGQGNQGESAPKEINQKWCLELRISRKECVTVTSVDGRRLAEFSWNFVALFLVF